jgi:hypothetical protein
MSPRLRVPLGGGAKYESGRAEDEDIPDPPVLTRTATRYLLLSRLARTATTNALSTDTRTSR